MKWTPAQREAIETTGTNLLVSAAAGSGKTAVLAERCAYLVCDAPNPCDISQLLVVTFTKAAAAEMRSRIEAALRRRIGESSDPRLEKQIRLIDRAQISTLHGFCQKVLRQHFHELGIDPNFRVLDEEEIQLLRTEIARQVLDERYEFDSSGQFQRFVDLYGNGDDTAILWRILHLSALMTSVVDPDKWLVEANERVANAIAAKPLAKSELGGTLLKTLRDWLTDLRRRWVQLAGRIAQIDGLDAYAEYVNELIAAVGRWREMLGDGNFDALAAEVASFDSGRLPTIRNAPPEKEAIQAAIDSIRKEMKEGAMIELCRFTESQWRAGLEAISEPTSMLIDLVREFDKRFARAKRELRGLDFADLECRALEILRDRNHPGKIFPSAVAQSYCEQFKHVLVDEYQDINEVQDAILTLISAANNQFCVGDVKQSIYRFRLAQPKRFLDRYEQLKTTLPLPPGEGGGEGRRSSIAPNPKTAPSPSPALTLTLSRWERGPEGKVIDLSANFRSREPLLNIINAVFERLMSKDAVEIEYDQSHRLVAGATYPPMGKSKCFTGSPVELHLLAAPQRVSESGEASESDADLDRTEREAAFVAQRINELISSGMQVAEKSADGSLALRPLKHRDIVVLMRALKYKSEQFAQLLRAAGIPVHCETGAGYFQSMEIRDIVSLLRVLDNQQQDVPLAAILRSPLSGLAEPDDCLARIRLAYPDSQAVPFHRAIIRYADEQDDELAAQLRDFLCKLQSWRKMAHQRPLAEVIWHIYDTTGYLAFCAGMEDGQQRVANLIDFHERARQFGSFQRQGLSRFMQFLNSLAEQQDLGQPSVASEADDVVRVTSIHRSKGLEFPVVFLPDLGKKHNFSDTAGSILVDRDAGIGLMVADEEKRIRYPSLAQVIVQERIRKQTLAEELRVLYVAMTRAREHLILVGTCDEDVPTKWREEWSGHAGRVPAERVLGARSMLDWIGPAAAAIEGAGTVNRIEITWHGEAEIQQWSVAANRHAALSEEQMRLARLEPLEPAPPMHAEAQRVKNRLMIEYPHHLFTKLPAAQSVGDLTKHGRFIPSGHNPSREPIVRMDSVLPSPRCIVDQIKPTSAEIGTATHLVLEHLDFSRACDREDLSRQVTSLVDKKLLDPAMAKVVDLDSILWLVSTPLGAILRQNGKTLRREVSVYYPLLIGMETKDPLDRIMVRGKVDLLIPDDSGSIIVDFKTDRVTLDTVDARADFYRPQLASYRDAIQGITGKPVKSAVLVFLAARVVREV